MAKVLNTKPLMYLLDRGARAVSYLAVLGGAAFGVWGLIIVLCAGYTAFLGDDSFDSEEQAELEKMAYSLPPDDLELEDMELHFFLNGQSDEGYEETMNF